MVGGLLLLGSYLRGKEGEEYTRLGTILYGVSFLW